MTTDTGDSGGMDAVLLATIQAAQASASRSPLKSWLTQHHDAIATVIAKHGANWKRLSRVWVEKGLIPKPDDFDAQGKAGDAARERVALTAKRTWLRVRAERREAGQVAPTGQSGPAASAQREPPNVTPGGDEKGTEAEAEALDARRRSFGVSKPKGYTPGGANGGE